MTERIVLLEREVRTDIRKIGITPDLNGYWYISDAVEMISNCSNRTNLCITRELYPKIAERRKTTASAVERGIRHAITRSFKNGYLEHIYEEIPTNKLFLFDLTEKFI